MGIKQIQKNTESKKELFQDRYDLVRQIGSGASAQVFEAVDTVNRQTVALKIFSSGDQSLLPFFKNEFKILTTLVHPNLVRVFDFGVHENSQPYFSMELIEGDAISPISIHGSDGELDINFIYNLVIEIANVLDYIHSHHIIHGDLKPSNIFILRDKKSETLKIKLMDFGLSSLRGHPSEQTTGTIDYMPPEVIRGEQADGRSDLYSFGAILYELIASITPFHDDTPRGVLRKHLYSIPKPLRELIPSVPSELSDCILKMLEKNPALRFHSAFELLQFISKISGINPEITSTSVEGINLRGMKISREKERSKIIEHLTSKQNNANMVLLEGEFGVGKSYMLRELRSDFQLEEKRVANTTCIKNDVSFRPVLRLLHQIFHPNNEQSSPHWNIIATFFPNEFDIRPLSIVSLESESEKYRLFHAVASVLSADDILPMFCFIDDLHLADQLTLDFVPYLTSFLDANHCPGFNCIIAVDKTELPQQIKVIQQSTGFETIRLQPFTLAEATNYIEGILGKISSPSFINAIHRQTGGNPLYLEEVLSFCEKEKIIERTTHGWLVHERDNISRLFPSSLKEIIAKKITQLSDTEVSITEVISLSPIPIEFDLLAFVTGIEPSTIVSSSLQLLENQILDIERGFYRLKKSEIAFLYQEKMQAGVKKSYHDRYIQYYTENNVLDKLDPSIIAHHFFHSSFREKALPYLLRAGESAINLFSYTNALRYFSEALNLFDQQKNPEERFEILIKLIDVSHVLAQRTNESDYIEESMVIAAQVHDKSKLASVFQRQTEYFLSLGEFERARKSAEKALTLFETIGDKAGSAKSMAKIGWTYYRSRQGEELLKYYENALDIYKKTDTVIDEGNLLVELGLAYYAVLESPEKALDYFTTAHEKFEKVNYKPGIARALGNSGLQKFHLGKYDDALQNYDSAQKIYTEIGDLRGIAIAYNAFGQALLAIGRYSEALRYLEEGLKVAKEIGDVHAQERNLENLGELYLTLGVYQTSQTYYMQARNIAEKIGNTVGVISNDIELASILTEQKEHERALKLLMRSKEQIAIISDINVSCWLEYRFGACYQSMAGRENFENALEHFRSLGDLADQHGYDSLRVIARSYLGMCHAQIGNVEQALEFSESALQLMKEVKTVTGGEQDILYHHAKILRLNKKASEAAAYISQAHDVLLARAQTITESELYRSYLENVRLHSDIIRDYSSIYRSDSLHAVAAVRERNLKTLYEVSRTINSILDLPTLLDTIMDQALQTMNGERGMIFLIEDNQLVLKVARNVESETVHDATEISTSIINDVIHGGAPIVVTDAQQNENFKDRQSVKNFKIHSLICVPLKSKEKLIGTVYVDSRMDAFQAVQFSEVDKEFLEAFSNLAAIAIDNAQLHIRLMEENIYLRAEIGERFGFENIIGQSKPMQKLFQEMKGAIASEGNVLIMGESGTGKELIARAIHYKGPRKVQHFIPVDCGALPDALLESELFGYKKGAFTGAFTDKRGLFEEAHLGTLFLDEIANTSLAFQAKLLRVLQEGEYRRVGDTESRFVNVRIVCATNKELKQEIAEGHFRQDLFYRLNVIPITVPPLRDRSSDIPLLIQHFLDQHNARTKASVRGVSKELVEHLTKLPWLGNVRELENLISRMLVFASEEILSLKHLPSDFTKDQQITQKDGSTISIRAPKRLMTLNEAEREYINYILQQTKGNKTEAAKILDLKRTTLVERMKKLGMM